MAANLTANDNGTAVALFYTFLILQLVINCCIMCCKSCARQVPMNYIMLTVFTGCWAYILTYICALYDKDTVLCAALMTVVLTVTLTVFAVTTKVDFTGLCGPWVCFGLLLILVVQMLLALLSMWIFTFTETWIPFAAGFCVIIYGLFLLIDVQLIVGGRRHELSIDDYVVGAMLIYLDVIMIFLELLKIFGR